MHALKAILSLWPIIGYMLMKFIGIIRICCGMLGGWASSVTPDWNLTNYSSLFGLDGWW